MTIQMSAPHPPRQMLPLGVGLATRVCGDVAAWAVVTSEHQTLTGFLHHRGGGRLADALLAASATAIAVAETTHRDVVLSVADPAHVEVLDHGLRGLSNFTVTGASSSVTRAAQRAIDTLLDEPEDAGKEPVDVAPRKPVRPSRTLLVATDGSSGPGGRGQKRCAGSAWVAEDGTFETSTNTRHTSPLMAELRAILLALKSPHLVAHRLHVVSDCQDAVDLVTRVQQGASTEHLRGPDCVRSVLRMIAERLEAREPGSAVRVSWVRGHSDHTLNQVADRLAVSARRSLQMEIDPAMAQEVQTNIVDDGLPDASRRLAA